EARSEAPAPPPVATGAVRASSHSEFGASGSPPPAEATGSGFDFGSYGRVGIGSDLRGHSGYGVNVVSHGSRLEEPAYLELNFYYGGTIGDRSRRWRIVFVPAYSGDLFHTTGNFSQNFAIRNAYAEVENLGLRGLTLWAGSRLYRGDDVYLFDFWPLDVLNTVGGGAIYAFNQQRTLIALHLGMNRLDDLYQFQQVQVPARRLPGDSTVLTPQSATSNVTTLDRQRLVMSLKGTHFLRSLSSLPNGKLVVYGEFHYLPKGERQATTPGQLPVPLADDYGYLVGAQLGGWLRSFVFANLFFRHAGGLAVFGDLGKPTGFNADQRAIDAREYTVALSGNYESRAIGLMTAAYFRNFSDGSPTDNGGFNEGAVAVRPTAYFGKYFHTAIELSYQVRRPLTVDQDRGTYLLPQVARASIIPIVAPLGRGTYSRPILYAVYTLSYLSNDAQYYLFEPQDVRAGKALVHYLGLGAEWWFNSSYR
ncbi:MAG TPA: carbohydrate porin, partial [Pseudomonadota bacterium]|nr:carbohydrate porin [Pseudomonadota bacterium]